MTRALFAILAALGDRVGEPKRITRALFERFWHEEYAGCSAPAPQPDGTVMFEHTEECYGFRLTLTPGEPHVRVVLLWSDTRAHEDIPEQAPASTRLAKPEHERIAGVLEFYEEVRSLRGARAHTWSPWWRKSLNRARRLATVMRCMPEAQPELARHVWRVGEDELQIEIDGALECWRVRVCSRRTHTIEELQNRINQMQWSRATA